MTPVLTYAIIGVTVVVSLLAFQNRELQYKWMFNPYTVNQRNEYIRFISSGFIHNDWGHLLFNMITLYFFGSNVEFILQGMMPGVTGSLLYIGLYLAGIVISSIPTYVKHRHNPGYNSLGASGGVSSVLFASIMLMPTAKLALILLPIPIPGWIFGIIYMIYSYYAGRRGGDNINHDAHLWGAIFGVVFIIILEPAVLPAFIEEIRSTPIF
ncbi:rhomboid family intramembrane serine protease [Roseivirga sp. BDSF3-8]|uniref:rhomboid family intramembrane serine protease n=1 Tax=Roseivirga sp. BDSF3-8 TaxID=3241598 RepID=UPI003531BB1A